MVLKQHVAVATGWCAVQTPASAFAVHRSCPALRSSAFNDRRPPRTPAASASGALPHHPRRDFLQPRLVHLHANTSPAHVAGLKAPARWPRCRVPYAASARLSATTAAHTRDPQFPPTRPDRLRRTSCRERPSTPPPSHRATRTDPRTRCLLSTRATVGSAGAWSRAGRRPIGSRHRPSLRSCSAATE